MKRGYISLIGVGLLILLNGCASIKNTHSKLLDYEERTYNKLGKIGDELEETGKRMGLSVDEDGDLKAAYGLKFVPGKPRVELTEVGYDNGLEGKAEFTWRF